MPPWAASDFVKTLLQALPSLGLGGVFGVWLQARSGRRVRLKVGEIEVEAQTVEEVERLLACAQEILQRNQAKAIQEP